MRTGQAFLYLAMNGYSSVIWKKGDESLDHGNIVRGLTYICKHLCNLGRLLVTEWKIQVKVG